ncbi:MAG: nucleoside deaminase [Dysgonamonadaceae bacterium]|nr:nucleoside deaminase [Dysgonamonadaceae bacterium]MDD4728936.1 nucleoside deaminase [Dysgonamonadaceae bacterium]
MNRELTTTDKHYLALCIDLAEEALNAGDKPFGFILIDNDGKILAQARNKVNTLHALSHPEYELTAWALKHLTKEERQTSTMYTSGEHCPMCAGAHGMAEIGTVVYAASGRQYTEWLKEFNIKIPLINLLPIEKVIKVITVRGPAKGELLERIKELHKKSHS